MKRKKEEKEQTVKEAWEDRRTTEERKKKERQEVEKSTFNKTCNLRWFDSLSAVSRLRVKLLEGQNTLRKRTSE